MNDSGVVWVTDFGVTIDATSQVGLLSPTSQSGGRWFEFDRFTGYANSSEASQFVLELSTPMYGYRTPPDLPSLIARSG